MELRSLTRNTGVALALALLASQAAHAGEASRIGADDMARFREIMGSPDMMESVDAALRECVPGAARGAPGPANRAETESAPRSAMGVAGSCPWIDRIRAALEDGHIPAPLVQRALEPFRISGAAGAEVKAGREEGGR